MSPKQGATDYAVGVALRGGGGFRGMAHIGVLRELERRDLGPDFIADTSWLGFLGGARILPVEVG
jgi:NTE family protein